MLTKIVDGMEVVCDASEESEIRAEWLVNAKTDKINTLYVSYLSAIHSPITYGSIGGVKQVYLADRMSIQNLHDMLRAYETSGVPVGFYWVAADNAPVPFTYDDMQALAKALGDRGWEAFQNLQTKKAAVLSAVSSTDVDAITW